MNELSSGVANGTPEADAAARKAWLRGALRIAEVVAAVSAIIIAVTATFWTSRLQRQLTKQQIEAGDRSADRQSRNELIAILGTNLRDIDLTTRTGKAAFAICLTAATQLDRQRKPDDISFTQLLPHYDADQLRSYLAVEYPDILRLALAHLTPPKDVPMDEGYYTVIDTFNDPSDDGRLDEYRTLLRNKLEENALTNALKIITYERPGRSRRFSVIIGNRVDRQEAERRRSLILKVIGREPQVVRAAEFKTDVTPPVPAAGSTPRPGASRHRPAAPPRSPRGRPGRAA